MTLATKMHEIAGLARTNMVTRAFITGVACLLLWQPFPLAAAEAVSRQDPYIVRAKVQCYADGERIQATVTAGAVSAADAEGVLFSVTMRGYLLHFDDASGQWIAEQDPVFIENTINTPGGRNPLSTVSGSNGLNYDRGVMQLPTGEKFVYIVVNMTKSPDQQFKITTYHDIDEGVISHTFNLETEPCM